MDPEADVQDDEDTAGGWFDGSNRFDAAHAAIGIERGNDTGRVRRLKVTHLSSFQDLPPVVSKQGETDLELPLVRKLTQHEIASNVYLFSEYF